MKIYIFLVEIISCDTVFSNGGQREEFHGPSCFHPPYLLSNMSGKGKQSSDLDHKFPLSFTGHI